MTSPNASWRNHRPRPRSPWGAAPLLLLIVLLMAAACGDRLETPATTRWAALDSENSSVVILFVDGDDTLSQSSRRGLEMAVNAGNDQGGLLGSPLSLTFVTMSGDMRKDLEQADRLLNHPRLAAMFLHTDSDLAAALVRMAAYRGVVTASLASSPLSNIEESPPLFLDLSQDSPRQAQLLASFCRQQQWRRVGVYYYASFESVRFATAFIQALEGAGLSTVFSRMFDDKTEQNSLLDELRDARSRLSGMIGEESGDAMDAVFIAAPPQESDMVLHLVQNATLLPSGTPFLGGRGLHAALMQKPHPITAYCAAVGVPTGKDSGTGVLQPQTDTFEAKYQAEGKQPPDSMAVQSYLAGVAYYLAVQEAGTFASPNVASVMGRITGAGLAENYLGAASALLAQNLYLARYENGEWGEAPLPQQQDFGKD